MRLPTAWVVPVALTISAAAHAGPVVEPDGTAVPRSSGPTAVQLDAFFSSRGEPIDWIVDAASSPSAFSPLCGFTATFVLHQAECALALAWYNETGSPPQATDLHVVVPAGSPIGVAFSGADIKSDPAWAGGKVGFALVGDPSTYCAETHFTDVAFDTTCDACTPAAPWITALIYPSRNTRNAFYVAFEDGATTSSAFHNDGDFNDDVFFLTGLTCEGGGLPCSTGQPGICADGLTQCTSGGTTCRPLSSPRPERCNGLDDDCDGRVDDGDGLCQTGWVCDHGTCVQSCRSGEFSCPPTKACSGDGHCVELTCLDVVCPEGQTCVAGACRAPCDGIVCPHGEVCRVGACVDPCAGVTCGSAEVCEGGVCRATCDCAPCADGQTCDASSGHCVAAACASVACSAGAHCEGGTCVDDCQGAVCPGGQACQSGRCVDVEAAGGGGAGGGPFGDLGGAGPAAGGSGGVAIVTAPVDSAGAGGGSQDHVEAVGGCACRVGAGGARDTGLAGAIAIALAAWLRRVSPSRRPSGPRRRRAGSSPARRP
jgi:hypothetical protein